MKKLFFVVLTFMGFSAVNAQQGSVLLYGSGSLETASSNSTIPGTVTSSTNWSVNPGIGYQFNKHLTVGVQGGYSRTELVGPVYTPAYAINGYNGYQGTTISWSVGAFFRYTHYVGKRFYLYTQLNAIYFSQEDQVADYYIYNNTIFNNSNIVTPSNGLMLQLFPAVGIDIYKGFGLTASFGGINYTTQSFDAVNSIAGVNTNTFKINLGQQITLGISKNFTCHMHHRSHVQGGDSEPGMDVRHLDMPKDDDEEDAPKAHKPKHKKHNRKDDDNDD